MDNRPLPPGWISQWDANYQRYFFVNTATGVSTWDDPRNAMPMSARLRRLPATAAQQPYGAQPYGQQPPYGAQPYAGAQPYGGPQPVYGQPAPPPNKQSAMGGLLPAGIAGGVLGSIAGNKLGKAGKHGKHGGGGHGMGMGMGAGLLGGAAVAGAGLGALHLGKKMGKGFGKFGKFKGGFGKFKGGGFKGFKGGWK
ncbi:hypothetical protein BC831DRAFT_511062 [Entophlyctis helioformis]|nr:hypothetical protein BC831DRAFT_511062 [Entophlyctis helioformis]